MKYKCPHCGENIDCLNYNAYYSEQAHGTSRGTYDLKDGITDCEDSDCGSYDNWEEDNYTYTCPECNEEIDNPENCKNVKPKKTTKSINQKYTWSIPTKEKRLE